MANYKVQAGDNLFSIASRVAGPKGNVTQLVQNIAQKNKLKDPNKINIGQNLDLDPTQYRTGKKFIAPKSPVDVPEATQPDETEVAKTPAQLGQVDWSQVGNDVQPLGLPAKGIGLAGLAATGLAAGPMLAGMGGAALSGAGMGLGSDMAINNAQDPVGGALLGGGLGAMGHAAGPLFEALGKRLPASITGQVRDIPSSPSDMTQVSGPSPQMTRNVPRGLMNRPVTNPPDMSRVTMPPTQISKTLRTPLPRYKAPVQPFIQEMSPTMGMPGESVPMGELLPQYQTSAASTADIRPPPMGDLESKQAALFQSQPNHPFLNGKQLPQDPAATPMPGPNMAPPPIVPDPRYGGAYDMQGRVIPQPLSPPNAGSTSIPPDLQGPQPPKMTDTISNRSPLSAPPIPTEAPTQNTGGLVDMLSSLSPNKLKALLASLSGALGVEGGMLSEPTTRVIRPKKSAK